MRVLSGIVLAIGVASAAVTQEVYGSLLRHFKSAITAYPTPQPCLHPNGATLLTTFENATTGAAGYIARDDANKEIVIAFAGRSNDTAADGITASDSTLTPYLATSGGAHVHRGYYNAYLSVQPAIFANLQTALTGDYAGYTIVSTGYDIGGPLAVFAGLEARTTYLNNKWLVFTYGQPRTGDLQWATYVDEVLGFSVYRVTNQNDGVVKTPPFEPEGGYVHHPIEYHLQRNPSSAATTVQCRENGDKVVGEDENCSIGTYGLAGINPAHHRYFNIAPGTRYCT